MNTDETNPIVYPNVRINPPGERRPTFIAAIARLTADRQAYDAARLASVARERDRLLAEREAQLNHAAFLRCTISDQAAEIVRLRRALADVQSRANEIARERDSLRETQAATVRAALLIG